MTIAAASHASTTLLTTLQVKNLVTKLWSPAIPSGSTTTAQLAAAQTSAGAGDALIKGAHDASKQSFLFALKIAFSDADRAGAARQYLASTYDLSAAEKNDQTNQALTLLAQSIISRSKYNTAQGAFLSTYR